MCFASLSIVFKIHFSQAFLFDIPILPDLQLSPAFSARLSCGDPELLPHNAVIYLQEHGIAVVEEVGLRAGESFGQSWTGSPSTGPRPPLALYPLPTTSISRCTFYATINSYVLSLFLTAISSHIAPRRNVSMIGTLVAALPAC